MIPSNPSFRIPPARRTHAPRPDNLMLQAVSPRVWLPTMQIVWGVLTFWYVRPRPAPPPRADPAYAAQARCTPSARRVPPPRAARARSLTGVQVYAIRFLQGVVESSTFVGTHYILGASVSPASSPFFSVD